jgi:hypothetical protein
MANGVIADTSSVGINRMISFDAEAVLGDTALTMEELESIVAANALSFSAAKCIHSDKLISPFSPRLIKRST